MSDLVTAEYGADLVLLLVDETPVFAIVVEVQLGIDGDKSFRWLSYVATVRDRWRCPVALLVVTPDEKVAEWARQPIEFSGPGSVFVPLVLGPTDIPVIRRGQSTTPEAAVLSALAHARDPGNLDHITAAVEQFASLDEATRCPRRKSRHPRVPAPKVGSEEGRRRRSPALRRGGPTKIPGLGASAGVLGLSPRAS